MDTKNQVHLIICPHGAPDYLPSCTAVVDGYGDEKLGALDNLPSCIAVGGYWEVHLIFFFQDAHLLQNPVMTNQQQSIK